MMSRSKFIMGKLFYQRGGDEKRFYARQYKIKDSQLSIMGVETEEEVPTVLPPDYFQRLFEMDE